MEENDLTKYQVSKFVMRHIKASNRNIQTDWCVAECNHGMQQHNKHVNT